MANLQNLRVPTSEEAREIGRKGGKASGAKRAARKSLKEALLLLLNEETDEGQTYQEAMIAGVIKQAIAGDVRAAVFVRDTIGENPDALLKVEMQQTGRIEVHLGDAEEYSK